MAPIRWLTGFSGTSGLAIVGAERREFLTDSRYSERAADEVATGFDRITLEGRLVAELAKRLTGRVGFDDSQTSVRTLNKLREAVADDVELVPTSGLVAALRRTKDAGRDRRDRRSVERLLTRCLRCLPSRGLRGRTETTGEARRRGAHARAWREPSFPIDRRRLGRTALCRTPKPGTARSAPPSWSCLIWARSSTAIAQTGPGRSPAASCSVTRSRSTNWCARAQHGKSGCASGWPRRG